ncbi:MAG: CPBP family intramembrane metalloprotease, partial [Nitrososphaerota archaeon]|nr:CPBP family intramembrane metalloprotease [Nitrososphaerota archaeon]
FIGQRGDVGGAVIGLMLLGLLVPSITAICTVAFSKSSALKLDLRNKLIGLFRVKPIHVLISVVVFCGIIIVSILLSTLFGQSISQFSFAEGFSFSIGGAPTLLTLIIAAFLEEMGWRGYAEDSIANYCSWWKESLIFGAVWALWHLPLFLIPETYQYNILQENPWFMINFFVSIIPMGFLFTWVYVKNNRSILACMIFHFFVNFLQEQIALTSVTKCVETLVLFVVVGVVVMLNKEMFFEKKHIGNLLEAV